MKTEDLSLFHLVADCQSFTQAASISDLPVANVSRRIKALEQDLGFMLFQRTTRQLRITEAGDQFYQRTRPLLNELNNTLQELQGAQQELKGRLRIQMFADSNLILPLLQQYQQRHPGVTFDIVVSDRELDLVENGFDLGMRLGKQRDSSQVARQAGTLRRLVVASPDYLARHGRPERPEALSQRNCVLFRMPNGQLDDDWQVDPHNRVKVQGDFIVNQQSMLSDLILSGHGIGFLPNLIALPLIQEGKLEQLFEGDPSFGEAIWLIYSSRQLQTRLLKDFIEFILTATKNDPTLYHIL
ncbi:DNA-binding transcriptional regulator, LysR family [Ferrimonas sediminum]|uniref:DNA-binding transcriptional regulator, LysR family n=1 Tax=Ferrimonas sediminum TaxID=718193 RepID=A0A1G8RER3_9GAMM|nr:LysR family transcriptional regulator [Ferrimonas sediminum]SDJ15005.1 DNA-binding transcriptional regulator, LysR family [Ferrimonas sediminum]